MIVGLGLIAPFFIYILAGVVAQLLLRHEAEQQRWLDAFIFYLALPALLFQSVRVVPPGAASLLGFLAVTTAMTGLMFVIGWLIGRGNKTQDHPAVFGLAASYSNIGYMGPALTVAVLGPAAGAPAASGAALAPPEPRVRGLLRRRHVRRAATRVVGRASVALGAEVEALARAAAVEDADDRRARARAAVRAHVDVA